MPWVGCPLGLVSSLERLPLSFWRRSPTRSAMFNPIPYVRAALGLFGSLSIQGAVSVSMGGALAYVGVLAGCSAVTVPLLLFAGMAIPLWPLRVYYSPDRVLTRK